MMAAAHNRDKRDTVLVVVQLSGGNDGLNTVVPYEDDEYAQRDVQGLKKPPFPGAGDKDKYYDKGQRETHVSLV